MRHNRNKGFMSILVIILLSLVGFYLIIISGILKTMQSQSSQMLLEAKTYNLQQSGLAFFKNNKSISDNIKLNLDDDLFKNCSLTISKNDGSITLNSECCVGQQKKTQKLQLETGKL